MTTSPAPKAGAKGRPPGWMRGLALLLAVLLVLIAPLAWLAFDLWRVVFNPTLVKSVLTDEVVNSDLVPVGLAWTSEQRAAQRVQSGEALSGVDEPDIVLLLSYLDRDDWRAIKTEVLTDEYLTHLTSVTTDGTYAWIDSADRVPNILWDTQPFKDRVFSDHGIAAITIAYDKLAPCTDAEIADFLARQAAMPPGVEVLYNLCEFPDPWHDDQFGDYVEALEKVVENIPAQFALTTQLAANVPDQQGAGPEALKGQLRQIRLVGMWAWLPMVVLPLLIGALAVRSLRDLSRWLGLPLLVAGVLTLLPALAYSAIITSVLAAGPLSETPEAVRVEVTRVLLRLAAAVFQPMLLQAIVMLALAIGLMVWHAVRSRQRAGGPARPTATPAVP